jgi:hypothetical protein
MKQISINEACSFAFATLKKHATLLLLPGFIIGLFSSFASFSMQNDIPQNKKIQDAFLSFFFNKGGTFPYGLILVILLVILYIVLSLNLEIGYIKIGILAYDGVDEDLSWSIYNQFGKGVLSRFILGSIVVGLIIYCGTFLLIIPGIIFCYMYFFAEYILVEKKIRITEALEMSSKITNGVKWSLFGNSFVIGFLVLTVYLILILLKTLIGFYYYPIELIVTPPAATFTTLAFIHFYKDLSDQQSNLEKLIANSHEPQPPIPIERLMRYD